ncbi:MAG: 16S rRNA (uracil(1498)-N(3))-methyltransferase [Acidobacteriota bacterium]
MSLRRFILEMPPQASVAVLTGSEAYHLSRVLRARPGQSVEVTDGSGSVWRGRVGTIEPNSVEVVELELLASHSSAIPITLIQSLCRSEKLDWILEKVTEIGVSEIFLLQAERSVVRLSAERISHKMARWTKILTSAAKQSHNSRLPLLHAPCSIPEICGAVRSRAKFLMAEDEKQTTLKAALRSDQPDSVTFCIGPEGGWTPAESEHFCRHGFRPVSLGSNILRTETAAIVVAGILKYELTG